MPSGKPVLTHIKDKKISIYERNPGKDKYGEPLDAWEPISATKLWANYRSLSGGERFAAMTAGFTDEVVFTVNWNSKVKPGMHVVFKDKVYEITRVDDFEGYKKDLRLVCKQADGAEPEAFPVV